MPRAVTAHRLEIASQQANRPVSPIHLALAATSDSTTPYMPYTWARLLNRKLVELAKNRDHFARTGKVVGTHFLCVEAPVRHGKSLLGSIYFPAWWLGTFPDDRVILTGNNAELAEGFSRQVRSIIRDRGRDLFGSDINVSSESSSVSRWDMAPPHRGGLFAVGVGSPPIGRGANLLCIDDPISGGEQAYSAAYRESLWRWWQFSIRSRLEPGGVCVIIMSRWSADDLIGRLRKRQEEADREDELRRLKGIANDEPIEPPSEADLVDRWEILHLPALAEPTPENPDPLGREWGEALCPQRYDREALLRLRDGPLGVGPIAFQAQYQNSPVSPTGEVFNVEKFQMIPALPLDKDIRWIRQWDLAATEKKQSGDPDWTAGVLMGRSSAGYIYVADARRTRRDSGPVEKGNTVESFMRSTAVEDQERLGRRIKIRTAQDPGGAGKAHLAHLKATVMAGFDFDGEPESGDKLARAMPFANQVEAGNVSLVEGDWYDYRNELLNFPRAGHDDWVDASALAYQHLAGLSKTKVRLRV